MDPQNFSFRGLEIWPLIFDAKHLWSARSVSSYSPCSPKWSTAGRRYWNLAGEPGKSRSSCGGCRHRGSPAERNDQIQHCLSIPAIDGSICLGVTLLTLLLPSKGLAIPVTPVISGFHMLPPVVSNRPRGLSSTSKQNQLDHPKLLLNSQRSSCPIV